MGQETSLQELKQIVKEAKKGRFYDFDKIQTYVRSFVKKKEACKKLGIKKETYKRLCEAYIRTQTQGFLEEALDCLARDNIEEARQCLLFAQTLNGFQTYSGQLSQLALAVEFRIEDAAYH